MKKTGKFKNESISQGMCMGAAIGSQKEKLVKKQVYDKDDE